MTDLRPLDRLDDDAPLRGVSVLELAGEYGGYAGRLLCDLGAAVTRVSLAGAAALEPALRLEVPPVDAAAWYLHRDKTEVLLDPARPSDRVELERLLAVSDVVLQSGGADAAPALPTVEEIASLNPTAVHVILTPFGLDGPAAGFVSSDLVRLAAGGLLWLGGYPDAEPVAVFGGQSTVGTGIFGAVAALLGLCERDRSGEAHAVEVSAQEVVTQALETSVAELEFTGRLQRRLGDLPREAGSGVFECRDGYVSMVAGRLGTAEAWTRLRRWFVEDAVPGAESLWETEWDDLAYRRTPEAVTRFTDLFQSFARRYGKQELYVEAQRRSIALAPVNSLADVLADLQLAARDSITPAHDPVSGSTGRVPGPPFRLSPLGPEPDALTASDLAESAGAPPG